MTLLWSANFIIAKVALHEFPPLLLCALRIGIAGMFLAPIYWQSMRAARAAVAGWPSGISLLAFLAICQRGQSIAVCFWT